MNDLAESFIKQTNQYIKISAARAANYFDKSNITFEFFEGTSMKLSKENCELIYKDIIRGNISNRVTCGISCGLIGLVIPIKECDDNVVLNVKLGVMF